MQPAVTVVVLVGFVVYSTWSIFTPHGYFIRHVGPDQRNYLTPFYSPCITDRCGEGVTWRLPGWWPFSAAILMMPFPLLFRATCYYYRKAYYRSFWLSPPACAAPDINAILLFAYTWGCHAGRHVCGGPPGEGFRSRRPTSSPAGVPGGRGRRPC